MFVTATRPPERGALLGTAFVLAAWLVAVAVLAHAWL